MTKIRRPPVVVMAAAVTPDLDLVADQRALDVVESHPGARLIMDAFKRYPGIDLKFHLENIARYGFDPSDPGVIQKAIDYCVERGLYENGRERIGNVEREDDPRSVVYYVRLGNRVKIGRSTSLIRRLDELQVEELITAEPGASLRELERHRQFAGLRVVGEWFTMAPELKAHMQELTDAFAETFGMTLAQFVNGHRAASGLTCRPARSHI